MSVQWINSDVELAELVLALGHWQAGRGPLQHRLAGRLREAVTRGDLPPGARLPPERTAAARLGVSRGTLAAAYRLLCDEGSLEQRQGSGTRVTARQGADVRASHAGAALQKSATLTVLSARGDVPVVDLTAAILHGPTGLPASVVQSIGADILEAGSAAGYYPLGYEPLREALAAYLTQRGTPTRPEQVLVTTGAQQAISLAAAHLLQPGDVALIEDPTYPGAIGALGAAGARLVGVPSGRLGVDVQRLGELAHQHAARMVYVIPSFQNPTGGVCLWVRLPAGSAQELSLVARRYGVAMVAGPTMSPSNGFDDYVRLPYAIEESALAEGIRRLAEAWASYAPSAGRQRGQLTLVV
jgi:DNA-binding transcriptional MocR family regulator